MKKSNYIRLVQKSVTVFLHHKNYYLFLHRNMDKKIDPGRLNGIGGRLEPGENYLDAAIRETFEETGYVIQNENMQLSGVVVLEGGYSEDWDMCFFKVEVKNKIVPKGNITEDGELIWIHKDEVLDTKYELVDDLQYSFLDIVKGEEIFFLNCQIDKNEKVVSVSKSILK